MSVYYVLPPVLGMLVNLTLFNPHENMHQKCCVKMAAVN